MEVDEQALEGIAEEWCRETGCEPIVDGAVELVAAGFTLVADPTRAAGRGCLVGDVIYYSPGLPAPVLQFVYLHELGHALARRAGCDSEEAASYIGAAVAMPRRMVKRIVKVMGYDLEAVVWAFAGTLSYEAVGRRLSDVYPHVIVDAVDPVFRRRRFSRQELPPHLQSMTTFERALVEEAMATKGAARPEPNLGAWYVEEAQGPVVYVLCDREVLEPKLARATPRLEGDEAVGDDW